VKFTTPAGLVFSFSDNRHHKQGCRFIGDGGYVHVNRGGIRAEPSSLLKVAIKPDEEHLYVSRSHHGNFLECIRTRRDPVAPVEAGHAATTLTIIGDLATRAGRKCAARGACESASRLSAKLIEQESDGKWRVEHVKANACGLLSTLSYRWGAGNEMRAPHGFGAG
jgi:hypothetical protein